ncbi:MAG: hypothetical protein KatS3mg031_0149 [Chitinophagales bacterium]|nr:MAG: hypothetical protein KatS3mg031_0149 [Chitinophagales bacterium]
MAARWLEYEQNKEGLLLRYETAGDERVRDSHRILQGITRPVNDPFWNTYYPPNDWNCRCDVIPMHRKSDAQQITPDSRLPKPQLPKNFQNNVAKTGVIFRETHPYFALQEQGKKEIADFMEHNQALKYTPEQIRESRRAFDSLPSEFIYRQFNESTGGYFAMHAAERLSGYGFRVILRPKLNNVKTYDFLVNDVQTEYKMTTGNRSSIQRALTTANHQKAKLLLPETKNLPGARDLEGAIGGFKKNSGFINVNLIALISGGRKRLIRI